MPRSAALSRVAAPRLRGTVVARTDCRRPSSRFRSGGSGHARRAVRMALLVVLEQLTAAERTVFVLADVFAVGFDEIATIVGRSPAACRQLAVRARARVAGDLDGLVAVLHDDVVGEFDSGGFIPGAPLEPRSALIASLRSCSARSSHRGRRSWSSRSTANPASWSSSPGESSLPSRSRSATAVWCTSTASAIRPSCDDR